MSSRGKTLNPNWVKLKKISSKYARYAEIRTRRKWSISLKQRQYIRFWVFEAFKRAFFLCDMRKQWYTDKTPPHCMPQTYSGKIWKKGKALGSKAVLLLWIVFIICVSRHTVLSVLCSLVVTCWESADLLALVYVTFSCEFVTFPYDVLGMVWGLFVWIPCLSLLPFF